MDVEARALVNGVEVDPSAPAISLFDRGFLYADGVFEVLRTYGGRPCALEDHLARMNAAAAALGISLGVPNARWISEVRTVLASCPWSESVLRLTLTRGVAPPGVAPHASGSPTRIVLAYPLPTTPSLDGTSRSVITLRAHRSTASTARKTLEYLTSILALREAADRGANDAILLDARGFVTEASTANVFVVTGDEVVTTPEGVALPGVTQRVILDAARSEGYRTSCRPLAEADLWTADEIFLSSSVREVVPVRSVDDHEVPEAPGEVTRRIHRRFGSLILQR